MQLTLVLDTNDPDPLAEFWAAALDYDVVHRGETYHALRAKDRSSPTLLLQRVSEQKVGKNRMHFDIHTEDFDATLSRVEALGARRISDVLTEEGMRWIVLADPQSNEFCICTRGS